MSHPADGNDVPPLTRLDFLSEARRQLGDCAPRSGIARDNAVLSMSDRRSAVHEKRINLTRGKLTMGKLHAQLDDRLIDFINRQHVFFVGTAPSLPDGHLNISPKGLDTFRVLGPTTVAYLDLTGSGIETVAHLRENGRLTIMFCASRERPHCTVVWKGRVVEPGDAGWNDLIAGFPSYPGERSVIILEIDRIADSCGFAVPVYEYRHERTQLTEYARRKGPSGLEQYRAQKNRESIDGLEGLARIAGNE